MAISQVLEDKRKKLDISYTDLGERTEISYEMVRRFCKGIARPNGEQFIKLCAELDLELSDFDDEKH